MTPTEKLTQIAAIIVAPESAAAPAADPRGFHRNPGAPYVEGETAFDNIPRAMELAGQGRGPGGGVTIAPQDLESYLVVCDKLNDPALTMKGKEDLVEGAGATDTRTACYAILTGWTQGGNANGRLSLYIGEQLIADLVKKASDAHGKPGVA